MLDAIPGLNLHLRNVATVALSKIELPVLCDMRASITFPLPEFTVSSATPDPVTLLRRASYG
jgi:hypothetical protein